MFVTHRATRSPDSNWKNVSNRYVTVEYQNGTASEFDPVILIMMVFLDLGILDRL